MTDKERVHNYFVNGNAGDYVYNDENGKKLVRPYTSVNSLVDLYAVKDGKATLMDHFEAIDWLFS